MSARSVDVNVTVVTPHLGRRRADQRGMPVPAPSLGAVDARTPADRTPSDPALADSAPSDLAGGPTAAGTVAAADHGVLAGARATAIHHRRVGRALFVAVVIMLGAYVAPRTYQPASRYSLTAALADHGTIDIGHYRPMLGIDRAVYKGHLRSDKGPAQPLLAVPFYEAAKLVGAPSIAPQAPLRGDLMLWWLTLWSATVPFALLCALVYRRCARYAPRGALPATIALMGASIALPHAVNLYAHALSALLGYAAYAAIAGDDVTRGRVFAAGFLAAAAIATEYQLALVAATVFVMVLLRARRRALWFVGGALPPLAGLAYYQWRAFGAPWHTPFAYYAGKLGGTSSGGYSVPRWAWFSDAVLGNRGLLITSPIVLVALIAAIALAVRRPATAPNAVRREAVVGVVVFAAYLALVSGWSGTPWLEEPGPRYLIAAIPFLGVPLAVGWRRLRTIATIATLWGGFLMVAAATTFILVATDDTPVNAYVNRVANHRFLPTVWSLELGTAGPWLYAASVVLVLHWLYRTAKGRTRTA
jgi:hypothetical protein